MCISQIDYRPYTITYTEIKYTAGLGILHQLTCSDVWYHNKHRDLRR